MQYGTHFTKRFMDPKKINNHAKKTKSHNQEVGRKVRTSCDKRYLINVRSTLAAPMHLTASV